MAEFEGWYARQDSNLRPLTPEASALSAELRAHEYLKKYNAGGGYLQTPARTIGIMDASRRLRTFGAPAS